MKYLIILSMLCFIYIVDAHAQPPTIAFEDCELTLPGTAVSRRVECASFKVPLGDDSSAEIELGVVKLKAQIKKPEQDPLLMVAGGPGQAASEVFLFADKQFEKLNRHRDIILIDQRGTGRSALFACAEMYQSMLDLESIDEEANLVELGAKLATDCLASATSDARYFTTSVAVRDFEAVRKAMAIEQWNLLGVSYGTRVALHYLRMFPEAVRSLVLDSVVYPEHRLGTEIAYQSQLALDRLLARCGSDSACAEIFPDIKDAFPKFVERLRSSAVTLSYEDFLSGKQLETEFTLGHLILVLRMSLYQDDSSASIPLLLNEAIVHDNYAPLARRARLIADKMADMMALGMHNSVICTEDVPYFPQDNDWKLAARSSYMGESLSELVSGVCSVWPRGVIDRAFKEPVSSDKPVLLLSGSDDPITPPAYADKARVRLSNARHLIAQGQGHNVSSLACAPTLIAKFIDELDVNALESTCLSSLKPAPFFIDFNGPRP